MSYVNQVNDNGTLYDIWDKRFGKVVFNTQNMTIPANTITEDGAYIVETSEGVPLGICFAQIQSGTNILLQIYLGNSQYSVYGDYTTELSYNSKGASILVNIANEGTLQYIYGQDQFGGFKKQLASQFKDTKLYKHSIALGTYQTITRYLYNNGSITTDTYTPSSNANDLYVINNNSSPITALADSVGLFRDAVSIVLVVSTGRTFGVCGARSGKLILGSDSSSDEFIKGVMPLPNNVTDTVTLL